MLYRILMGTQRRLRLVLTAQHMAVMSVGPCGQSAIGQGAAFGGDLVGPLSGRLWSASSAGSIIVMASAWEWPSIPSVAPATPSAARSMASAIRGR